MWTFLSTPMMSVNCRLTKRTLALSACSNTRCFIAAVSVPGMSLSCSYLRRAAAQRGANLQCELQVETRFRIFEIDATQQLLDAFQPIDQRIAVHVQVARRAHVVASGSQERVQRANELRPTRGIR